MERDREKERMRKRGRQRALSNRFTVMCWTWKALVGFKKGGTVLVLGAQNSASIGKSSSRALAAF